MEVTKTVVCKLDTTEEDFRKLMDTVKAFRDACNYISEVAWNNRVYNPVALHHFVYYETRERFNLPANLAIRARDRVSKSYKVSRKKQHKFRKLSMDLDKRLFTLLRNEFRVSISTIEGRVKPKLAIGDYQKELLKNPVRDAKLVYRTKEFYIHITVLIKIPELSGNNPIGVDIGINKLLVASNGFSVNGKPIEHRRQHFRNLGSSLQKKGTFSSKRKLKRLSGRERRWVNTVLHQISRAFVNSLNKDFVVMEKLNGIRNRVRHRKSYKATFHNWAFYRLQQMIEYKCLEKGIPVVYIEPSYTSQKCPRCGTIDKRNRRSQALFRCINCGFQHNSDRVASVNLAELARQGWAAVNQPDIGVHVDHLQAPSLVAE